MDRLLEGCARLYARRLGEDAEDEEEISGTPNNVDCWVLNRIACLIPQLRRSENPADFWRPILGLDHRAGHPRPF
jgi:hypothetical protein